MKEIIELNQLVLKACGDWLPKDGIYIQGPDDTPGELKRVPEEIQQQIRHFRKELRASMPDDFGYVLFLGTVEPSFWIDYNNGMTSGGSKGRRWEKEVSIFSQIAAIDWDEKRAWVIQGTEMMDEMRRLQRLSRKTFHQRKCCKGLFASR